MRKRDKKEVLPPDRHDTVRHEIMHELEGVILSANEISGRVSISEKEVYAHLEHIQKSMADGDRRLKIIPAECIKCGFIFRKRERLKKPGRCPVCHGEHIQDPMFSIISRS